jgi:hypothetical protein
MPPMWRGKVNTQQNTHSTVSFKRSTATQPREAHGGKASFKWGTPPRLNTVLFSRGLFGTLVNIEKP